MTKKYVKHTIVFNLKILLPEKAKVDKGKSPHNIPKSLTMKVYPRDKNSSLKLSSQLLCQG